VAGHEGLTGVSSLLPSLPTRETPALHPDISNMSNFRA
jgi:hypothetical protein